MTDPEYLLSRCRPLSDAVVVAQRFLFWSLVSQPFLLLIATAISALSAQAKPDLKSIALILSVISGVGLLSGWLWKISFSRLIAESSTKPELSLFLRAFRSDKNSDQLRAWLKAAMGTGYKLSGIRPPRERASWFSKFLNPVFVGLRYSGSRQFEMEAPDHNWMARLLGTFSRTRFVFIDVRDITVHVLDEIGLAWQVFGPERCVFIVDERHASEDVCAGGKPTMSWRRSINNLLERAGFTVKTEALKLLIWPGDDSVQPETFRESVQGLLQSIPVGRTIIRPTHVDFVRQRVTEENWDIRFHESEGFLIGISITGIFALHALWSHFFPRISWLLSAILTIVLEFLYWSAWGRALRNRRLAIKVNPTGPPSAGLLWGAACFHLLPIAVLLVIVAAVYNVQSNIIKVAQKSEARATMFSLCSATQFFETEYDRLPSTPSCTKGMDCAFETSSEENFIDILLGRDEAQNPRQQNFLGDIRFVDGSQSRKGGLEMRNDATALLDPWGRPYHVALDLDYDGKLDNPNSADAEARFLRISKRILVWSSGPDGDEATWKDNICSWTQ